MLTSNQPRRFKTFFMVTVSCTRDTKTPIPTTNFRTRKGFEGDQEADLIQNQALLPPRVQGVLEVLGGGA